MRCNYGIKFCAVCRPSHLILSALKPVFFAKFNRSVALTDLAIFVSMMTTQPITLPPTHVRGVKIKPVK